jgi:tRNA A-37 threonylcarbamoyl transferase component Bud32/tetratricopeptide (TPR) repeat protein
MEPMHDPPAARRVSHYRILHALGAGGMGEVYAGYDETLKRRVAIKAIRSDRLDSTAKARFLREAQILSQLDHPNICRVYDYVEDTDSDWLVLELIDGRGLRAAIHDGLDRHVSLKIAEQITAVLIVTHAAGIVHRDLKPGNVMLTATGEVKVLDFGLAHSLAPAVGSLPSTYTRQRPVSPSNDFDVTRMASVAVPPDDDPSATSSGQYRSREGAVVGTVGYMSPEQAAGERATTASDMYSFGLLLQELFTGRPPYDRGLDYEVALERARKGETAAPVGVTAEIAALIQRLKSVAPSQRPTAIEAAERLRWIRERPKRRLRRLLVAAAAGLLALAATKYTIDLARERSAAIAARDDANRRRQQAENLIGFMLGDLRGKLQQAGRLELLEAVGREATAYFKAVPPGSITSEELFRRSQTLYQIGQIRQAEGKLKEATDVYRESLSVAETVAARDLSRLDWQLGVATAHFYLGDVLRIQSDLAGAMREFTAYRDIARRLVEREPANERWALELSYGNSGVAAVQELQGDLEGARGQLESALAIKEELARRKPGDIERQQALATGHNRLGVVLNNLGHTESALMHYLADLEIRRHLVATDPSDYALKRGLQVAISFAGHAYEERGDLRAATEQYQAWLDVTADAAAVDPRNVDWQRDFAVAESTLANVFRLSGRLREAERHNQTALAVIVPLARASPTQVSRQRDLAFVELGAGLTSLDRGDIGQATSRADNVERITTPLVARGTDRIAVRLAAEGRLLAADAAEQRGDIPRAHHLREQALALLPVTMTGSADRRALDISARALIGLNRTAEARPIVERLVAGGYSHPALMKQWEKKGG